MKYLVCTDVAARGIDVSGLPYGNMFISVRFWEVSTNRNESVLGLAAA